MTNLYHELHHQSTSIQSEKRFFYNYRANGTLQKAISGEQTVEDALMVLASIDQPVTRLLPRRRDEERNSQIRELEELVGNLDGIKSNGFFYLDNFFSGSVSTSIGFFALYTALGYIFDGLPPTEEKRLMVNNYVEGLLGANLLISAFLFGPLSQMSRARAIPFKQAEYLDKRIQQLYRTSSK